jgi:hypothetical protein
MIRLGSATVFPSTGDWFEWTGGHLHWRGLAVIFDNSTGYVNEIKDQATNSAGLTDLADGECVYVDLDRTQNLSGADALVATKTTMTTLGAPTTPGSRYIFAWRYGSYIYTRDGQFFVGVTQPVATTSAVGTVKLNQTPGSSSAPVVPAIDTNGLISVTATVVGSTSYYAVNGVGANSGANTSSSGVKGTGGTSSSGGSFHGGNGIEGVGGASDFGNAGIGVKGTGGAATNAAGAAARGGSFTGGNGTGAGAAGVGVYATGGTTGAAGAHGAGVQAVGANNAGGAGAAGTGVIATGGTNTTGSAGRGLAATGGNSTSGGAGLGVYAIGGNSSAGGAGGTGIYGGGGSGSVAGTSGNGVEGFGGSNPAGGSNTAGYGVVGMGGTGTGRGGHGGYFTGGSGNYGGTGLHAIATAGATYPGVGIVVTKASKDVTTTDGTIGIGLSDMAGSGIGLVIKKSDSITGEKNTDPALAIMSTAAVTTHLTHFGYPTAQTNRFEECWIHGAAADIYTAPSIYAESHVYDGGGATGSVALNNPNTSFNSSHVTLTATAGIGPNTSTVRLASRRALVPSCRNSVSTFYHFQMEFIIGSDVADSNTTLWAGLSSDETNPDGPGSHTAAFRFAWSGGAYGTNWQTYCRGDGAVETVNDTSVSANNTQNNVFKIEMYGTGATYSGNTGVGVVVMSINGKRKATYVTATPYANMKYFFSAKSGGNAEVKNLHIGPIMSYWRNNDVNPLYR